jgi:hypothetical protein
MPAAVMEMLTSPWGIFLLVLVGLICGLFVHAAAPQPQAGLLGVMVRGFLGVLAGVWAAAMLQLPDLLILDFGGVAFPLAWALLGGIIFMMLFRILRI